MVMFMKTIPKRWRIVINAVIAALLVFLYAVDAFSLIEYNVSDMFYQRPSHINRNIIVVGIEEASLEKFGRFQDWERYVIADTINISNSVPDEKPAVITIDVIFSELSKNAGADEALVNAVRHGGNVIVPSQCKFTKNTPAQAARLPKNTVRYISRITEIPANIISRYLLRICSRTILTILFLRTALF